MSQVPGHFYPNFNMDTIGLISFISISVISEYCNSSSRHSDVENPYFILNSYKIVQQRYIQNGCIESLCIQTVSAIMVTQLRGENGS